MVEPSYLHIFIRNNKMRIIQFSTREIFGALNIEQPSDTEEECMKWLWSHGLSNCWKFLIHSALKVESLLYNYQKIILKMMRTQLTTFNNVTCPHTLRQRRVHRKKLEMVNKFWKLNIKFPKRRKVQNKNARIIIEVWLMGLSHSHSIA